MRVVGFLLTPDIQAHPIGEEAQEIAATQRPPCGFEPMGTRVLWPYSPKEQKPYSGEC
jgi:hypothetical protein